jgi:hypothetical protein
MVNFMMNNYKTKNPDEAFKNGAKCFKEHKSIMHNPYRNMPIGMYHLAEHAWFEGYNNEREGEKIKLNS